jgi:hypothetical protein
MNIHRRLINIHETSLTFTRGQGLKTDSQGTRAPPPAAQAPTTVTSGRSGSARWLGRVMNIHESSLICMTRPGKPEGGGSWILIGASLIFISAPRHEADGQEVGPRSWIFMSPHLHIHDSFPGFQPRPRAARRRFSLPAAALSVTDRGAGLTRHGAASGSTGAPPAVSASVRGLPQSPAAPEDARNVQQARLPVGGGTNRSRFRFPVLSALPAFPGGPRARRRPPGPRRDPRVTPPWPRVTPPWPRRLPVGGGTRHPRFRFVPFPASPAPAPPTAGCPRTLVTSVTADIRRKAGPEPALPVCRFSRAPRPLALTRRPEAAPAPPRGPRRTWPRHRKWRRRFGTRLRPAACQSPRAQLYRELPGSSALTARDDARGLRDARPGSPEPEVSPPAVVSHRDPALTCVTPNPWSPSPAPWRHTRDP